MSTSDASPERVPTDIRLDKAKSHITLVYSAGEEYALAAEYLRIFSPSAEVQGHSPDQAVLQSGKRHIKIHDIQPVGHYAIKIIFSDGHDSGLYTWRYLYTLAQEQQPRWDEYLDKLQRAGQSRDA